MRRSLVTMARVEHAAVAVVILIAFVTDLRFVVPVLIVVLLAWAVRYTADRIAAAVGAAILAAASVAFVAGSEVAAWTLALGAAVLAGVSAFGPTAKGRRPATPRGAGSSNRAP